MKHKLLLIGLALAGSLNAQELKSKKGENYLPEAKDCALQIDAVPFLNYTGQLLSNAGSNSPSVASPVFSPFTIGGKYFTSASFAYRAKARIGLTSSTVKNAVVKNQSSADTVYVSDSRNRRETNITISVGFEKRRGKTRLQGYYGAEAMLIIGGGSTKYSYGNALSSDFPSVYTTDFETPTSTGYANSLKSSRITTIKKGTTFGIGARAFFGAEYFIFPKISLAAELGWGVSLLNTNDGYVTTEKYDAVNQSIKRNTPVSGGNKFGIDTDNSGGQLMLSFHF